MKITVGHLYPDVMSADGDRGNVRAIVRRCGWRGIAVAVTELRLGDPVRPGDVDMIVIGGGAESRQRVIAADLYKVKGAGIRDAVAGGAAAIAVGGGFELFGRFCQPAAGAELPGIGLFDCWTMCPPNGPNDHRAANAADPDRGRRPDTAASHLMVHWADTVLIGFETQGGSTYLGPGARPLGQVLLGRGNNGDGSEGCLAGAAVGTHLHGPCLPANPALADFLIGAALAHRYGSGALTPLADDLELAAHDAAIRRAGLPARGHGIARALRRPSGRGAGGQPGRTPPGVSVRADAHR
jgi:CobQ-like glutamine amidotransferase family enzyme